MGGLCPPMDSNRAHGIWLNSTIYIHQDGRGIHCRIFHMKLAPLGWNTWSHTRFLPPREHVKSPWFSLCHLSQGGVILSIRQRARWGGVATGFHVSKQSSSSIGYVCSKSKQQVNDPLCYDWSTAYAVRAWEKVTPEVSPRSSLPTGAGPIKTFHRRHKRRNGSEAWNKFTSFRVASFQELQFDHGKWYLDLEVFTWIFYIEVNK